MSVLSYDGLATRPGLGHPLLGFEEELLPPCPLGRNGSYDLPPLGGVLTILPLLPVPVLASFPRNSQELPCLHLLRALDDEATFQPLLPLLAFDLGHVFDSLGVIERLDQPNDGTLVFFALLDPPGMSASVWR